MTPLELISFVTSRVSVIGWVVAGCYQLFLSAQSDSVEGFSPFFLAGYVTGDIFNVLGCFWGRQMTFQKVISCCTLATDSVLTIQYIYLRRKERTVRGRRVCSPISATPLLTAAMVAASHAAPTSLVTLGNVVVSHERDWEFLAGQLFAWAAQIFYVAAMVPQVVCNYRRKCTGGVSRLLFIADLVGGIGYVATIVVEAQRLATVADSVDFLFEKMPYLLGTSCCIALDLTLMVQYYIYPDSIIEELEGVSVDASQAPSSPKYEYGPPAYQQSYGSTSISK